MLIILRRLIALFIDVALITLFSFMCRVVYINFFVDDPNISFFDFGKPYRIFVDVFFISLVLYPAACFTLLREKTVGMKILKLVMKHSSGLKVMSYTFTFRHCVSYIMFLIAFAQPHLVLFVLFLAYMIKQKHVLDLLFHTEIVPSKNKLERSSI